MTSSVLEDRLISAALEVESISNRERLRLDQRWHAAFGEPPHNRDRRLKMHWVEKGALELYRAESPAEFLVLPTDWKIPAYRCRGAKLPEFEFEGICVTPADESWV